MAQHSNRDANDRAVQVSISPRHLKMIWGAIVLAITVASAGGFGSWQLIRSVHTPDDVLLHQKKIAGSIDTISNQIDGIMTRLKPENIRPDPWTKSQDRETQERVQNVLTEMRTDLDEIRSDIASIRNYLFNHTALHQRQKR